MLYYYKFRKLTEAVHKQFSKILSDKFYMGILDTIIQTKQTESFSQFKPTDIVKDVLAGLKDRDRQILVDRYGLEGQEPKTLAAIGQEQKSTRERVRQIEKDLLKNLKKSSLKNRLLLIIKIFCLTLSRSTAGLSRKKICCCI